MTGIKSQKIDKHLLLLRFRLAGRTYAINVHSIREIIFAQEPTPIPKASRDVLGVIELREQIIPVISLKNRLGISNEAYPFESPRTYLSCQILVLHIKGHFTGLLIDGAQDVLSLAPTLIEPAKHLILSERPFIKGIFKWHGDLVLLLDPETLIPLEELTALRKDGIGLTA